MTQVRLDKFLANAGCGTRSEVKQLLKKGLVEVNGVTVREAEKKIDPKTDQIICRGEPISEMGLVYYMLNKPAGYLSATQDARGPVVLDLIHEKKKSELFPVGRLDIDTEGLLLLTNDGPLAHELLSPKKHVDKCYRAEIEGIVTEEDCRLFEEGLDIGEKRLTMPADLRILETAEEPEPHSHIEVTIREGKYHQVKRMFEAVGKKVRYLERISMGSLVLDRSLERGSYRKLTDEEIEELKNYAGK